MSIAHSPVGIPITPCAENTSKIGRTLLRNDVRRSLLREKCPSLLPRKMSIAPEGKCPSLTLLWEHRSLTELKTHQEYWSHSVTEYLSHFITQTQYAPFLQRRSLLREKCPSPLPRKMSIAHSPVGIVGTPVTNCVKTLRILVALFTEMM